MEGPIRSGPAAGFVPTPASIRPAASEVNGARRGPAAYLREPMTRIFAPRATMAGCMKENCSLPRMPS